MVLDTVSQSQAWERMLSQNAIQLTLCIKEPAESQKTETEGGETSLVS